jgi:predicted amino acid racemase
LGTQGLRLGLSASWDPSVIENFSAEAERLGRNRDLILCVVLKRTAIPP